MNQTKAVAVLRDEVATAAEMWANAEYAHAESIGAGGPDKTEDCAKAEDNFRNLLEKLAAPPRAKSADDVRNAALEEAANACDAKFSMRESTGHVREASTARALAEEIRALKSSATKADSSSAAPSDLTNAYHRGYQAGIEMGKALVADEAAPAPTGEGMSDAASTVLAERQRQVSAEDWTHEHDDAHPNGEIAAFAAVYAMPPAARDWLCVAHMGYGDTLGEALCPEDWTPKFGDRRRELVKAGALILAEIERLDRASDKASRHAAAEAWLK